MPERIIIFGVSGHAKVIVDIIEKEAKFELIGFIDNNSEIGTNVLGYEVIGPDSSLNQIITNNDVFGGIIGIGDNAGRAIVKEKIINTFHDFNFVNCIHPNSVIGKNVTWGEGNVVMAGAIINSSSELKNHCIVNTNSSLDHDCIMSDFSSIAPNATVGGNVVIGEYSAIGIGANVFHQINIGANCIIGGGSLVCKDTENNSVYYGAPCKLVRNHNLGDKYL
jgi:sugar O-acyltransferase (sialic acid O-acetyltransferase NeuD family)